MTLHRMSPKSIFCVGEVTDKISLIYRQVSKLKKQKV